MDHNYLDQAWKRVLVELTDAAIEFFLPELAEERDPAQEIVVMKDELPAIDKNTSKDMRVSDVCFSVPLSTGKWQRVAFYVEQQHRHDENFSLRMYEGYYRTSERLKIPVTSLAIFTGNIEEVNQYKASCFGTELSFRYNSYHVASADIEALRSDRRVFSSVILAAALMLKAAGKPQRRMAYAEELLRVMRGREYDRTKRKSVLLFMNSVFRLEDNDIDKTFKEGWHMRMVPVEEVRREYLIEDIRRAERFEGEHQGKLETARAMLARNFDLKDIVDLTGLSENEIRELAD